MVGPAAATVAIAGGVVCGIILRPWRLPEAVWAVTGAVLLVITGLLPISRAWRGVLDGTDVYLFLAGMMLLAEIARAEGLFDWLAGLAARIARGSAARLFALVYLVGTIVTIFLSNDATAVVLTPAVAAVARTVGAAEPLPYLLICAFIANAASFVLPISNPANLVIYGADMPPLLAWLPRYALPSLLSIAATYAMLWLTQRRALAQAIAADRAAPSLGAGGRIAGFGIVAAAAILMLASAFGVPLGWPTFLAGAGTTALVALSSGRSIWGVARRVSWSVLPLVAGLFVLVEALTRMGVTETLSTLVQRLAATSVPQTAAGTGIGLALASNLVNNLPAGLIAGTAAHAAHLPQTVTGAILIGVDLGPNLSVTGSLATILWLTALRREGHEVGGWAFLKLGVLVMPPALLLALGSLILFGDPR